MDPLSRLNVLQLQDPLPKPLDLTKQISEALDLVKKKPSRSDRASGTDSIRSPRSESARSPVNAALPNGLAHEPAKTPMTATGNAQTGDAVIKVTKWRRTGEERRERSGAGPQDAPSSRQRSRFPLTPVETLASECSGSGHADCVSSDDSSAIEVPLGVPTSNGASLTRRDTENEKREKEAMENSSPSLTEWDAPQDSDSVESRNVPSTSEAENADFCKPTRNGSGSSSSSSSSQKMAPATKKTGNQRRSRTSAGKKATASAAKRRKKKKQQRCGLSPPPPSAFPSHEPEIKLKYTSCKEEKREGRGNTFAPYVRMEFSDCTIVNFEEDGDFQARKRRPAAASPGIVPTSSCLQLGRLGSEGRRQTGELCCLCGRTANAAGLGDLHGPYRPCGPDGTTSSRGPDGTTSSRGPDGKCHHADLLMNGHEDAGAKRKRTSDEVGERWVHEDCSIWSAGVFLVKGRLYGLDEALRLAQQAVCSCCHRCGSTLGCFFKGCPNKYHFPCALQAECVFNEENFTLRCPEHKNKSALGASRLQNRCHFLFI
ncbi:hypothetical protein PDJAM_G00137060 [Pangasius djambal]|uniref:Uncharacterized protein n=1 Tax=Pangasius djambal TaxID=1691987 RepID=A0ACC5ZFW1_9TELE|nr:hypothetical protein [Pangasius djambal]